MEKPNVTVWREKTFARLSTKLKLVLSAKLGKLEPKLGVFLMYFPPKETLGPSSARTPAGNSELKLKPRALRVYWLFRMGRFGIRFWLTPMVNSLVNVGLMTVARL